MCELHIHLAHNCELQQVARLDGRVGTDIKDQYLAISAGQKCTKGRSIDSWVGTPLGKGDEVNGRTVPARDHTIGLAGRCKLRCHLKRRPATAETRGYRLVHSNDISRIDHRKIGPEGTQMVPHLVNPAHEYNIDSLSMRLDSALDNFFRRMVTAHCVDRNGPFWAMPVQRYHNPSVPLCSYYSEWRRSAPLEKNLIRRVGLSCRGLNQIRDRWCDRPCPAVTATARPVGCHFARLISADRIAIDPTVLHVQVFDVLCVRLDELLARGNIVTHEHVEDLAGTNRILDIHLKKDSVCRIHGRLPKLIGIHLTQTLVPLNRRILRFYLLDDGIAFMIAVRVALIFAGLNPIKRRLCNIQAPLGYDIRHVPEKECQKQRSNVGAVDISVGHDDHTPIAQFRDIESVANARSECSYEELDLIVRENLIQASLFHIEYLAFKRQYCLKGSISSLLGRTTGRVTLDQVNFALFRIPFLAVGQFSRKSQPVES